MLSANAVVWRSSNVLFCSFFFFKVLSFFQSFFLYSNFLGSVPKRNETVDSQCGCVSAMFKVFARVVPVFTIVMRGEFSSSLPHPFFACASLFSILFFSGFCFSSDGSVQKNNNTKLWISNSTAFGGVNQYSFISNTHE